MKTFFHNLFLSVTALALLAVPIHASAAFAPGSLVQLAKVGNTKSPNFFSYSTGDALATIEASNYFQSAALKAGDAILVKASDGKRLYTVTAATGTTSTIAVNTGAQPVWVYCRQKAANLGTAGAAGYCVSPIAGTVTKFYTVLSTVVDADNIINLDKGGTNMTGSATIAASGVAIGDVDSATVSADNTVAAGDLITVETDGGGTAGVIETYIQVTP